MSEPAQLPVPLVPPLVLAGCGASAAGAAALANCAVLAALLRRSPNGIFSIIIQLAVADLTLIGTVIGPELWSCNSRTWYFGSSGCMAYRGLNVFASTASLYLVACIALHALATFNLEQKDAERREKRSNPDEDDELRTSRHSLVNSDTSTPPRTMNIDYRLADTRVPVTPPTAFVWVLSASLSVPEFTLATTVHFDHGIILCKLVESTHKLNMHSMLAFFNLFVPIIMMTTAGALMLFKLNSKRRLRQFDSCETIAALKLSLWLISVYCVLCVPRSILSFYLVYSAPVNESEMFQTVEAQQNDLITALSLTCSSAHLIATLLHPFLCIIFLPRLRKAFSFGSRNSDVDNL